MNKLIAPIILILAFTVTSCSDDAKKAINNIASQSEETLGGISNDRTILNPKLGNFCDGHECPEGIVAVKTEKKKLTCSGIVKSQSEVLISENCATENEAFNIQTTDGKLIKVTSVEDELSNEFGDKILKLNLEKEIPNTANIELPEIDNNEVQLNYFNELGELQSQDCELTYASLAYANSFDNESQLLNIKNCEGVRDGALISQNGKSIGFLTKKHNEIELYEGISLRGENQHINLMTKIEELSYQIATDSILQIGYMAFAYPINDFDALREKVTFDKEQFIFTKKLICFKPGQDSIHNDNVTRIIFNNELQELTENTQDETFTTRNYIPRKEIFFGHKLGPKIPLEYNFISTNEDLMKIEKHYFRNPLNNEILLEKYKFSANKHNLEIIEYCN
ncbi:putative lipoprotein [Halobacteriovorax sp. BALOs_7]|uniref:hypothetical protein n=1 Tax=Halobacteriovorax sp. BALOs_7 TaxID=2109558 RepID=UPI000EA2770A|nr:hypothetical protein [Halobacteriovorax sp. BALOs_7]AYF43063.1 putative lipoprotein [Halobacteriovorax sp. BALOs_7]